MQCNTGNISRISNNCAVVQKGDLTEDDLLNCSVGCLRVEISHTSVTSHRLCNIVMLSRQYSRGVHFIYLLSELKLTHDLVFTTERKLIVDCSVFQKSNQSETFAHLTKDDKTVTS